MRPGRKNELTGDLFGRENNASQEKETARQALRAGRAAGRTALRIAHATVERAGPVSDIGRSHPRQRNIAGSFCGQSQSFAAYILRIIGAPVMGSVERIAIDCAARWPSILLPFYLQLMVLAACGCCGGSRLCVPPETAYAG
jgi:hypothetical protein